MKSVEGYGHENVEGRNYSFLWDRGPRNEDSDPAVNREQLLQAALHDREEANRDLEQAHRQLDAALKAQRLLIDEVEHRVKNNLQMISSLIGMQARSVADPAIRDSLASMLQRVEALGMMQRRLYQSGDLVQFDLTEFTRELATELCAATARPEFSLTVTLELEPVMVPAEQAASLALIINELIASSLAHGLADAQGGTVIVSLGKSDKSLVLRVADAADVRMANANHVGHMEFSTTLVESLSKQLRATIERSHAAPGTRVEITIPQSDSSAAGAG